MGAADEVGALVCGTRPVHGVSAVIGLCGAALMVIHAMAFAAVVLAGAGLVVTLWLVEGRGPRRAPSTR